jgi:tetratricopeptide (TPR) repeat protein
MRAMILTALVSLGLLAAPAWAQGRQPRPPGPGGGSQPPPAGQEGEKQEEEKKEGERSKATKFVVGEQAPELEAANWLNVEGTPTLDRYKGRLVALYFFRTDGDAGETIATVIAAQKKFGNDVVFIGLTDQKKEQAEGVVKGKEVKFAVGCESPMREKYSIAGLPEVYLLNTSGSFVKRFHPMEDMEAQIAKQIELDPPVNSNPQALTQQFKKAEELLKNKKLGPAYVTAKVLKERLGANSPQTAQVTKLIEKIHEDAKKLLDQAKEMAKDEKRKEEACPILAELSVRFAGDSIGADADSEIGRLMGDGKLKPKLRKAIDNAKGEVLIEQGQDHEASKRFLEALKTYRQVNEQYPDTEASKTADASIQRIMDDPDAQERITKMREDEESDRWLDLADRFAKIELNDKAREYYQRILDQHPTARAAAKAKEKIAKLPEDKPEEPAPADSEDQDTAANKAGEAPKGKEKSK